MRQWRVIYDCPTSGIRNMAVDEAILQAVAAGKQPPTLRLYAWSPPCLSLGYGQRVTDIDFARLSEREWEAVRRPTGGRAILHTDELTYSLCLAADDPLAAGGILESYRHISAALLLALQRLGAPVAAAPKEKSGGISGPVCFEVPSDYEITVGGKKLVGSAQLRRKHGVLQHGSLPLHGDIARICDALVYEDEAAREQAKAQVRARATTLEAALGGRMVSWEAAAACLVAAASEVFEVELCAGSLSQDEYLQADQLEREVRDRLKRR